MNNTYLRLWKPIVYFLGVFVFVFVLILRLAPVEQSEPEKILFDYQIATIDQLSDDLTLEKPGIVESSQDIVVSAQVNGRVSKLNFKEGAEVRGGEKIVLLADTVADYALQSQRAKNNLERALLTKQQTQNNLQQQLQQAIVMYENAQSAFDLAQSGAENTLKQADLTLMSANSQIEALRSQFEGQKIILLNLLNTIIDAADRWLGVTEFYENQQTGAEMYLGAKDLQQRIKTTQKLYELLKIKEEVWSLSSVPASDQELKSGVQVLERAYGQIEHFSKMMIEMLKNSSPHEGVLSLATLNGLIQQFQSFQEGQAMFTAKSGFIAYLSQVNAQLIGSGTFAQDNAQISYNTALLSTKSQLLNSEVALKNAKVNYETLQSNYEVQIALLDAAITDAKIAYENALTQYAKLAIRSPISWVIGSVLVAEGQEIANGTPIFTISGKRKQQVAVSITANEYQYIQETQLVKVEYQGKVFTGMIDSISPVADKTNLFKVSIQLMDDVDLLGDVAKVIFPIRIEKGKLLPLERIKIISENQGILPILSGGQLEYFPIEIQALRGAYAQLKVPLAPDLQIITSDLSAFDESKHQLK